MKHRLLLLFVAALGLLVACDEKSAVVSKYAGQKVAPAPPGWQPPPPIGTKGYQGPPPHAPMRMSPYAAATAKGTKHQRRSKRLDDVPLRARIVPYLRDQPGKILFIGRGEAPQDEFGDLKSRFVDWRTHADVREKLDAMAHQGDSESDLAKRLAGLGAQWVLIDRYVVKTVGWLDDQADAILHRMSWSYPLDWFHPRLIGRTYALYRIAPPLEVTQKQGEAMIAYVRAGLAGEKTRRLTAFDWPSGAGGNELFEVAVGLRKRAANRIAGTVPAGKDKKTGKARTRPAGLRGRKVITRTARRDNLKAALDAAIDGLNRGWSSRQKNAKRRYGVTLPATLTEAIGELEVELDVIFDRAEITDRNMRRVGELIELGVDGIWLEYVKDEKARRHLLLPAFAVQRLAHAKGPRMFTSYLSKDMAGLGEDGWRDEAVTFGRLRSRTFLETAPGGQVVPTYRGTPLVHPGDVTKENLITTLERGCDYLARNQLPDGQFRYKYWAHRDRWVKGNNIVRHALNPYTVLMAEQYKPTPGKWIEAAKKGIGYTLRYLKCEGEEPDRFCYVWHQDVPAKYENAKIGTVAVTILSMIRLSQFAELSKKEEETLRHLGNFLVHMQDPNGHYRQYYVPTDHPYFGCANAIFPGEIQFALARLYGYFKDERFKKTFEKGYEYYSQWWKINSAKKQDKNTYTEESRADLVGFVPWQCMACEDMYKHTKDPKWADFALELQQWMDDYFLFSPNRAAYPDYLGAYFKFHGEEPAINSCGYTEGAAATYSIAKQVNKNREELRQNLLWGLRFAMQLQYREPETTAYFLPKPRVAMGGFRYCLNRLRLRNDYSYHALSAIYQGLNFLEDSDYPGYLPPAPTEAPVEGEGAAPATP